MRRLVRRLDPVPAAALWQLAQFVSQLAYLFMQGGDRGGQLCEEGEQGGRLFQFLRRRVEVACGDECLAAEAVLRVEGEAAGLDGALQGASIDPTQACGGGDREA